MVQHCTMQHASKPSGGPQVLSWVGGVIYLSAVVVLLSFLLPVPTTSGGAASRPVPPRLLYNIQACLWITSMLPCLSRIKQRSIHYQWHPSVIMLAAVDLFRLTMAMALYYHGLRDTTASYATNFLNTIPVVTFFLSMIARVETLRFGCLAGRVQLTGAVVCVGGAMVIGLYKGPRLHLWPSVIKAGSQLAKDDGARDWLRGTAMLVGSCVCYAGWFILQARLFKIYPSKYWTTMMSCVFGCAQAGLMGVLIDRKPSAWRLGWNLQLLTTVYSGVLNTAATFVLITWTVSQRGPTYPPMFNPLSLVFVTVVESLFMGQDLSVGSLLGMVFIIGGLYAFLWGKRKSGLNSPVAAVNPDPDEMASAADVQERGQQQQKGDGQLERMPPV